MYFDAITLTMNEERQQNVSVFNQETQLGGYKRHTSNSPSTVGGTHYWDTKYTTTRVLSPMHTTSDDPNSSAYRSRLKCSDGRQPRFIPPRGLGPSYTTANYLSEAFTPGRTTKASSKAASIPTPEEDGGNVCSSGEKAWCKTSPFDSGARCRLAAIDYHKLTYSPSVEFPSSDAAVVLLSQSVLRSTVRPAALSDTPPLHWPLLTATSFHR